MSKGPKTLTSTSQTDVDPVLRARQNALWNRATGVADQPYQYYTGQRFEDVTPDELASFEAARGAAGAGSSELESAIGNLGLLGGFLPPSVSGSRIDPSQLGKEYQPLQIGAGKFTDVDINKYLNPYISSVVDTALSDIERGRKAAITSGEAKAAAANAFGGGRHGVVDAETNRAYGDIVARTLADLRRSGFDAASGLATRDLDRALTAGQSNQRAALEAGLYDKEAGLRALL